MDAAVVVVAAGPAGICVGPKVGVMGLMGGRGGDDVRAEGETALEVLRRGLVAVPRAEEGAGWVSVAMVRPGMVATGALC